MKERGEVLWDGIIWRFYLDCKFGVVFFEKVLLKLRFEEWVGVSFIKSRGMKFLGDGIRSVLRWGRVCIVWGMDVRFIWLEYKEWGVVIEEEEVGFFGGSEDYGGIVYGVDWEKCVEVLVRFWYDEREDLNG